MDNLLKIVKESGINFSGSLVGKILGYGWLMVITRVLTPEDFGTFTLAKSVINISLIFVLFGTPKALGRFIPYYNVAGEKGKTKTLIREVLRVTLTLSVIVGVILFFGSGILSATLFNTPVLSQVLKIMVLTIPLYAFIKVVSASFIGYKELRYQVYFQQISKPILQLTFAGILLMAGLGLITWIWMYVSTLLFVCLLAYIFLRNKIWSDLSNINRKSISFKHVISYSWPLSVGSGLMLLIGQIDFIIIGVFRPSADVGIYRVYLYLVAILGLVLSSFAQIYKPVISGLIAEDRLDEVKETYQRVAKWIFNINAFGLIVVILFGTSLITIFFGQRYLFLPGTLFVLAAGRFINSAFGPEGMTLEAFGYTKFWLLNTVIILLVNMGLDYLLIPNLGIKGAAIATASAMVIGGLAGLIEIYIMHGLQPFKEEHLKYISVGLGCVLCFYAAKLIFQITITSITSIGLLIILLFLMYSSALYYTGSIDEIDMKVVHKIKLKLLRK